MERYLARRPQPDTSMANYADMDDRKLRAVYILPFD